MTGTYTDSYGDAGKVAGDFSEFPDWQLTLINKKGEKSMWDVNVYTSNAEMVLVRDDGEVVGNLIRK